MSNFFLLTTIASLFAGAYFVVKLGIGFVDKGERKTRFYGKRLMIAVAVFLVSFIAFGVSNDNEKNRAQQNAIALKEAQEKAAAEKEAKAKEAQQKAEAEKKPASNVQETPVAKPSPEGKIKAKIRSYVHEYNGTTVDSITVNPDMGTEKDGDYVALVRLTWNVRNDGELSKEMLDMYSSDMAIKIHKDLPEVQELAVFWTVPYLNGSAKISFERIDSGMKYTDKMFDNNFNK